MFRICTLHQVNARKSQNGIGLNNNSSTKQLMLLLIDFGPIAILCKEGCTCKKQECLFSVNL